MNLRELAALDHAAILSDRDFGFAIDLVVTNPAGLQLTLAGFASDVGEIADPQTNLVIQARRATCQLLKQPLLEAGLGLPVAVADKTRKPWRVAFADANGVVREYKVIDVPPENDLGSVRCELEEWKPAPVPLVPP